MILSSWILFLLLSFNLQTEESQAFNWQDHGYQRIAAVSPELHLGMSHKNAEIIIQEAKKATEHNASIVLFPEMSVTGYTIGDMVSDQTILDQARAALLKIVKASATGKLFLNGNILIVGAPYSTSDGRLFNAAFVISKGKVLGAIPKSYLPNNGVFYDKRWYSSGLDVDEYINDPLLGQFHFSRKQLFTVNNQWSFGVEICEDLWAGDPPHRELYSAGAHVLLNLSASPDLLGKKTQRENMLKELSARHIASYVYASSGPGESSLDMSYGGHLAATEDGELLLSSLKGNPNGDRRYVDLDIQRIKDKRRANSTIRDAERIKMIRNPVNQDIHLPELMRSYSKLPFIPSTVKGSKEVLRESLRIQANGLATRMRSLPKDLQKMVLGLSGGLDSTYALLVGLEACKILGLDPKEHLLVYSLPGFGTSERTLENIKLLREAFDFSFEEVNIKAEVAEHLNNLRMGPKTMPIETTIRFHKLAFENSQARARTKFLFNKANDKGGIVIGTGDASEVALGFATFNGDHTSNYCVNCDVPKTLIQHNIQTFASYLADEKQKSALEAVLKTKISPELLPTAQDGSIAQDSEAIIGPYDLNDFILYYFRILGFSPKKIEDLAKSTFGDSYETGAVKRFFKRYFANQFKRDTAPPSPIVTGISLSPRGGLRLPPEFKCEEYLAGLED